jgi:ribose 5-phosphate isomerase A
VSDLLAEKALSFVPDGAAVGLGTGRAATRFVRALGERARQGLEVRCIATSESTARLAGELGLRLTGFDAVDALDVTVDGADEVDPKLDLVKGLGGALLREKVVAAASRRLVILVGPEKLAPMLGTRGVLPVEVVPFALAPVLRRLRELGLEPRPREADGELFVTDNRNHIVDCGVSPISDPSALDRALRGIPGVAGTGLFLGMADTVLVDRGDEVEVRTRRRAE